MRPCAISRAPVGQRRRIGNLSRFQNPRELMGYLGLVPSENSTGDKVKRGGITKASNGRARRILVEAPGPIGVLRV